MSDDSDHAAVPAQQRAKRQRRDSQDDPVAILSFDSMGPDQTTQDASDVPEERFSDQQANDHHDNAPILQTAEEIGRLQMENVRLRVELDELRRRLSEVEQHGENAAFTSAQVAEKLSMETRANALTAENAQLSEQIAELRGRCDAQALELKIAQEGNKESSNTNSKLRESNLILEEREALVQERLRDAESEVELLKHNVDDLQASVAHAKKGSEEQLRLEARIEDLELQLQASQTSEAQVKELEEINAALRLSIDQKDQQLMTMQNQADLELGLNDENEELKNMLVELGARDHERAFALETLSSEKKELNTKLASVEADLEQVQADRRKQDDKIVGLEADAKSSDVQLREATHRLSLLEEAMEHKDTENSKLREEVQRHSTRDKEKTESLHLLNIQHNHLQRLNEDFKQRVLSQDTTIAEQRAEIRSLHSQCTEQGRLVEESERSRNELVSQMDNRGRLLEDYERQIAELKQRNGQLQSAVTELDEAISLKTQEAERQSEAAWQHKRAAEDELKRIQNEKSLEIETLNREHNEELATQLGHQQRVIEEVKAREVEMADKHGKQLQKLRAQIATLRADTASAESEYSTAKALLEDTRAQLNQTLRALEDLQSRTAEERARHASERQRLDRHSGELEAKSSRLQTELDELRRKDKAMDDRVQKLEETLVDQSMQLRQVKTPRSSDSTIVGSSQDSASEVDSLRREFAMHNDIWERMRTEMVEYINRINNENSTLRAELDRWQAEESSRMRAMEESLKRNFLKQVEQLESLASFKEDAQNSLVSVTQEDLRRIAEEKIALQREHVALFERAETLEIKASQTLAELSRATERLNVTSAKLDSSHEEIEELRQGLQNARESTAQGQARIAELESELEALRKEGTLKLSEMQTQLDDSVVALQASEASAQSMRIQVDILKSQHKTQTEATVKYVDMLFFIMKVDRRRIQDLTFVKKHLMLYFPPPVGEFPVQNEILPRRRIHTMYDAAIFALAVVRFRRGQQSGSKLLALEYEKKLRSMQ